LYISKVRCQLLSTILRNKVNILVLVEVNRGKVKLIVCSRVI